MHCQSVNHHANYERAVFKGLRNYSDSTLSSTDLKTVPADIPLDIVKLDLSRNNIKQLRQREFVNVKELKLLNLSGNSLESIDTGEWRAF